MIEQEFKDGCLNVDVNAVANEAFDWLLNNVNNYVDNADTAYLIYFTGETLKAMPYMGGIMKLYEQIKEGTEDDKASQDEEECCIVEFEKVVNSISNAMKTNTEKLASLFEKLIYFYDTKIITDGKTIIPFTETLDGYVDMGGFIFEPFPMNIEVKQKDVMMNRSGQELNKGQSKVIKHVTIEPGFCVQFEIVYWRPVNKPTSFSML